MAFTYMDLRNAVGGAGGPSWAPKAGAVDSGPPLPTPTPSDTGALGGLSTWGGVYDPSGRFFRGPGDLFSALRRGLIDVNSLGQLYFGVGHDPSASYANAGQGSNSWFNTGAGLSPTSGFQKGRLHFADEGAYNSFMQAFGGGGPRRQRWLNALLGM